MKKYHWKIFADNLHESPASIRLSFAPREVIPHGCFRSDQRFRLLENRLGILKTSSLKLQHSKKTTFLLAYKLIKIRLTIFLPFKEFFNQSSIAVFPTFDGKFILLKPAALNETEKNKFNQTRKLQHCWFC